MARLADDDVIGTPAIDRASATPLHRQVADALRRSITARRHRAGVVLPSETELALALGVSRQTVRQGLAQLASEGLLDRVVGRGTFVAAPRRARTGVIACVVTRLRDDLIAHIVDGAEQVGRAAGLRIQVANALGDPELERRSVAAATGAVDGVIIFLSGQPSSTETIALLERCAVPFVLVDRTIPSVSADLVTADNVAGGTLAARHLIDLGHRRFVVVRREGDGVSTVTERELGFRAVLEEAGAKPSQVTVIYAPSRMISAWDYLQLPSLADHPDVRAIADALADTRPSAAFAINDITGVLTILAAQKLGWQVPGALSVVGFGNDSHSLTCNPPLTTVHQSPFDMGRLAMELLLGRLAGEAGPPRVTRLPVRLVVRASSGPAGRT